MSETYSLIRDFSEHKFINKHEKIENFKRIKQFEEQCNRFKNLFDEITNKIKKTDMVLIESARNSFRISTIKKEDFSKEKAILSMNGKDYLSAEIEDREKTVNIITK